jgi:hypothetical protein
MLLVQTLPTRRRLWYIQGFLVILAFVVLLQQLIATRRYFFQVDQVLHHETVALFLVALAIGISMGTARSD